MMRRTRADICSPYKSLLQLTSSRGQVAVEYILLLSVGVTLAVILTAGIVSRNENEPGFLIAKWQAIIQYIGSHPIEE